MAKRFTDTNKYKKPFIRGLQGAYKLLWDYLYHDCDHAGIWIVDFEIAQLYLGQDMPVNKKDALRFFNEGEIRIIEIDKGKKWFIVPFINFQYGELNEQNRVHSSVLMELKKTGVHKGLISSLQGAKDKDKDKDKEMDKDKGGIRGDFIDEIIEAFSEEYREINQVDYVLTNKGKERSSAGKLLNIYKEKYPDQGTEEALEGLRNYFRACVSINDDWLRQNMSLPILLNKFNEINNKLRNGKHSKNTGATERELAEHFARKYGTNSEASE
jgi:hypothetical protein